MCNAGAGHGAEVSVKAKLSKKKRKRIEEQDHAPPGKRRKLSADTVSTAPIVKRKVKRKKGKRPNDDESASAAKRRTLETASKDPCVEQQNDSGSQPAPNQNQLPTEITGNKLISYLFAETQRRIEEKQSIIKAGQYSIKLLEKLVREKEATMVELKSKHAAVLQAHLATKGLLTARGIFELLLNQLHWETGGKGKFNAAHTCKALDTSVASARNGELVKTVHQWFKSEFTNTKFSKAMYTLYSSLSNEIHGHSWSGPGLRVQKNRLEPAQYRFLVRVAKHYALKVKDTDED